MALISLKLLLCIAILLGTFWNAQSLRFSGKTAVFQKDALQHLQRSTLLNGKSSSMLFSNRKCNELRFSRNLRPSRGIIDDFSNFIGKPFLEPIARYVLLPALLQVVLVTVFKVHPAAAAAASSAVAGGKSKGKVAEVAPASKTTALTVLNKLGILMKRVLLGTNAKVTYKTWRAGDTRSDLIFLINGFTMMIILGMLFAFTGILEKKESADNIYRMRKEVQREKKYRQDMFIEAVKGILAKLEDPGVKNSVKGELTRQLKDLDPDGKIRQFLEAGRKGSIDITDTIKSKREKMPAPKPVIRKPAEEKPKPTTDNKAKSISRKSAPQQPEFENMLFQREEMDDMKEEDEGYDKDIEEDDDADFYAPAKNGKSKSTAKPSGKGTNGPSPSSAAKKASGASLQRSPSKPSNSQSDVDKSMNKLFTELRESLEDLLPQSKVDRLIIYLKDRIKAIPSEQKRSIAMTKIAQKLGDDDYWIDYVENNLS